MEDRLLKFLDFNQYLRDHIDVFKEYFIRFYSKFYGEGIREEIEEKFSKCLFIGHQEPARLKTILNKIPNTFPDKIQFFYHLLLIDIIYKTLNTYE